MNELYDAATAETYARGTFGGQSGFGLVPAILVVDFCLGMTDPASPLGADMPSAIGATRSLLDLARSRRAPVLYTTVVYARGCADGGAFIKKVPALRIFEEGGPWSEIDPRLGRLESEPVIVKKFASAFFGTGLAALLTSLGTDTVIVTGCTTSGCVRASALDALQSGFRVIVPRECVADRAPGPHDANLFDLQAKYADVVSVAEVLAALELIQRPSAASSAV
jgi:nicotinamidase-related amidase